MAEIKVFYVEDEVFLGKIVKDSLESRGYRVCMVSDGAKVMEALSDFHPDIALLDVMLPNIDGFTLAQAINAGHPNLPFVFLTAKTQTDDVLNGFKIGAHDYVRKPFSMEELIARIENVLRINQSAKIDIQEKVKLGNFVFDSRIQILSERDEEKKLSFRESELLSMLYQHRNSVLDRKQILLNLWNDDSYFNSRNLDVYISKLRGYLKNDPQIEIITLKGQGYKFIIPD